MKVTIDLGKLLDYYDEHSHSYNLSDDNGFRAFMMDFLVQSEDEKKKNDDCIEKTLYFPDVQFKTRFEAESVLGKMKKEIDATGFVTVADYYDYSGQKAECDYCHWVWINLNMSYVYSISEHGIESFGIHLPNPMRIEKL